jgi:hypothetical protein
MTNHKATELKSNKDKGASKGTSQGEDKIKPTSISQKETKQSRKND